MDITVNAEKKEQRTMILSVNSGKFEEGDFKGEVFIGHTGGLLINLDNGDQYSVSVKDILIGLKNATKQ